MAVTAPNPPSDDKVSRLRVVQGEKTEPSNIVPIPGDYQSAEDSESSKEASQSLRQRAKEWREGIRAEREKNFSLGIVGYLSLIHI